MANRRDYPPDVRPGTLSAAARFVDAVRRARVHHPGAGRSIYAAQRLRVPGDERRRRDGTRTPWPRRNAVLTGAAPRKRANCDLLRQRNARPRCSTPPSSRCTPPTTRRASTSSAFAGCQRIPARPEAGAGMSSRRSAEVVHHRLARSQPRAVDAAAADRATSSPRCARAASTR